MRRTQPLPCRPWKLLVPLLAEPPAAAEREAVAVNMSLKFADDLIIGMKALQVLFPRWSRLEVRCVSGGDSGARVHLCRRETGDLCLVQ